MNRNLDELGRLVIPVEMRNALGMQPKEELNIELEDDKIILTKKESKTEKIKTRFEIEQKIHNLKELIKIGFDDEKIIGTIEGLEWVLDTKENPNDYLNDYDDLKEDENNE